VTVLAAAVAAGDRIWLPVSSDREQAANLEGNQS
jgi:hypothetical protein